MIRSLGCLHAACCVCIIDSFRRHGAKCPVCWQSCTQHPGRDPVIGGMLSIVYRLRGVEEPTFTLLGLDPDVFVRFFQSFERPPDNHQGDVQRQLQEVQRFGSTHEQDEHNVGGGDGAVSNHVNQQAHHGEGGGISGTVVLAGAGGVMASGEAPAVGPPDATTGASEDVNMEV